MATAVAYMKRLSSMQTKPECVAHNQQLQKGRSALEEDAQAHTKQHTVP